MERLGGRAPLSACRAEGSAVADGGDGYRRTRALIRTCLLGAVFGPFPDDFKKAIGSFFKMPIAIRFLEPGAIGRIPLGRFDVSAQQAERQARAGSDGDRNREVADHGEDHGHEE